LSYEDRIREAYPKLSKSFARLADFLLDNYIEAAFMTATELGHVVNVDATTVVRFSQQLGYEGYPQLLRDIRDKIKSQLLVQPTKAGDEESLPGVLETAMGELSNIFEQTYKLIDAETVGNVIRGIDNAQRIFLIPDTPTQAAAHALLDLLQTGGYPVSIAHNDRADLARLINQLKEGDLLIALEVTEGIQLIAQALREARAAGYKTVSLAGAASLDTARVAELVIAAQAQPSVELGVMLINAMIFAIGRALQWTNPDRYRNAASRIQSISKKLQNPIE
jgi:DNA-binding MurR/RpiR family transcriptional regulator